MGDPLAGSSVWPPRRDQMGFQRRYDLDRLADERLLDYALAARAAGDRDTMADALARLVFRYRADLVRRASIKVPRADAEEIASETMADAVRASFRGNTIAAFRALVTRILRRRIADYYERRERSVDEVPLADEHGDADGARGPDVAIVPDETAGVLLADLVKRELESLSARHRRAAELYAIEGASAAEAAACVNAEFPDEDPQMSEINVHQIASRFREDLRRRLAEADAPPPARPPARGPEPQAPAQP